MKNKDKIATAPSSFNGLRIDSCEGEEDSKILFYIGSDALENKGSLNEALTATAHIAKTIICEKALIYPLRELGIEAQDINSIDNIKKCIILGATAFESEEQKLFRMLQQELKKSYSFKLYEPTKTERVFEDNFYPGMSKKKGGFRHRFVRNK